MAGCLRATVLLLLVTSTLTQDFDLSDAVDDPVASTTAKPKEQPKAPEKPKSDGFDLFDAVDDPDPQPKPDKPVVKPPNSGGGGTFDDSDLMNVGGGDYKPDGGHHGGGGAGDSGHNQGGADEPLDPELLWGQILKALNANMPEEVYMWISNLKKALAPLLERAMDLLQAAP
ncbi:CD99 molecule isoform 2-T2 [Spinachia spinachia]